METLEWISYKEMNRRTPVDLTAKTDPEVSHIAGKPVRVNDPRLIALVVKWKKKVNYDPDGTDTYNFKTIPGFVEDVRKVFCEET
jgi:hypothetical protein